MGGNVDRFRNGRGVISGLVGVLLTNLLTWVGWSHLWYDSFLVDAIAFALAVVIFRVLSKTKGPKYPEKGFKEGALWILGVILGALLTIGVSAVQAGIVLGGIELVLSIVLFVAIVGASYGIVKLQGVLKPNTPPSSKPDR